jgi:hypothetical protein
MNSAIRNTLHASRNCALGIYACALLRSRSLYICRGISTNRPIFLQNEPKFPATQMNVSANITKHYDNKPDPTLGENKPNSNPNKPNWPEAEMSISVYYTTNYDNNLAFGLHQNKPKTNPISKTPKMNINFFVTKDYQNQPRRAFRKTNPNKPNFETAPRPSFPVVENPKKSGLLINDY